MHSFKDNTPRAPVEMSHSFAQRDLNSVASDGTIVSDSVQSIVDGTLVYFNDFFGSL